MKNRSPIVVFLLLMVTFGIYGIYWSVSTKNELNNKGAGIPTAWLLIVPVVNFYWMWKYAEGAAKVSNGSMTTEMTFVLFVLLGYVGMAIIQNEFNKLTVTPVTTQPNVATPVASFTQPTPPAQQVNIQPPTQTPQPPIVPPVV